MKIEEIANNPILIIMISLIIFLCVLYVYCLIGGRGKYKKIIRYQKQKRNCKISGNFLKNGGYTLIFNHKQNEIIVSLNLLNFTSTIFEVTLNNSINQKMEIYKKSYLSNHAKKTANKNIILGNESFDKEFIIKGNDERFIRKILTFEIQYKILKIFKKYNKAEIELYNNSLIIYIPIVIKTNESFDEIMDLTLKLIDKFSNY